MRQNYMKVNLSSLKLCDQLCKKTQTFLSRRSSLKRAKICKVEEYNLFFLIKFLCYIN